MGKIKSAIITAIIVAAVLVLAFFATVSFPMAGTGGVDKYNSFIRSIHLGGGLTGEAHTVLYPEGVISSETYAYNTHDDEEKAKEYAEKYEKRGSVYVEKDRLGDDENAFIENVKNDVKILNDRFNEKGYSSYSVSVQDVYTIRVTVPTNFTYAEYKKYDSSSRSSETGKISRTSEYLSRSGELSLRNTDVGSAGNNNILTPLNADITSYFKSFKKYSSAKRYAVKVNLTDKGSRLFEDKTNDIVTNASSDKAVNFYVGETKLISLTVDSAIDGKNFYITVDNKDYAEDYAIILDSVAHGNTLSLDYGDANDIQIVYATPSFGEHAAIYLGVVLLLVLLGAVIFSVVRYRKLGLVNALMVVIYALTLTIALLLIEIQLTVVGAFAAILGLALLCGSNMAAFEKIRSESKKGKTMQSAVKSGYKALLTAILDLHIIIVVASLLVTLICVGAVQACGFIMLIASVASYILYWFTRFMWFVLSSPARDKFKFCGFKREVPLDD